MHGKKPRIMVGRRPKLSPALAARGATTASTIIKDPSARPAYRPTLSVGALSEVIISATKGKMTEYIAASATRYSMIGTKGLQGMLDSSEISSGRSKGSALLAGVEESDSARDSADRAGIFVKTGGSQERNSCTDESLMYLVQLPSSITVRLIWCSDTAAHMHSFEVWIVGIAGSALRQAGTGKWGVVDNSTSVKAMVSHVRLNFESPSYLASFVPACLNLCILKPLRLESHLCTRSLTRSTQCMLKVSNRLFGTQIFCRSSRATFTPLSLPTRPFTFIYPRPLQRSFTMSAPVEEKLHKDEVTGEMVSKSCVPVSRS